MKAIKTKKPYEVVSGKTLRSRYFASRKAAEAYCLGRGMVRTSTHSNQFAGAGDILAILSSAVG